MPSSVTNIRNLFILLATLALTVGCTTAKKMDESVATAVAATAAPASETGATQTAESSAESGTAEAAESSSTVGIAQSGSPLQQSFWVVGKGEHLWGISAHGKVYGDPYQWPLLFKRNRDQIEDADLIYPGQVLQIERDLSAEEIQRAIDHAKSRGAWTLGITELTDLEYLSRERGY